MNPSTNASGATHVGQVRPVNQDAFLVNREIGLYIVADGMGGHVGGEVASLMSIQVIQEYIETHPAHTEEDILSRIEQAIQTASSRIYEKSLQKYDLYGMGTTVTLLHVVGQKAYVGQVGDSRLYLLRKGFIYQITRDHSLVSEQVRAGRITEEEAKQHKLRNIITRSVGYQERELVDTFSITLEQGDLCLLCSDGLYTKVSDQEIAKEMERSGLEAVPYLIDLANKRGGPDNITGVVVCY
jgi:serine/threonine protein phosphatase PrpC